MLNYILKEFCNNIAYKYGLDLGREDDITTGFSQLDDILKKRSFKKSNVIGLAAKPGMGITTFALDVALNIASSSKEEVIYFSFNYTKEEIFEMLLKKLSGISISKTNKIDDFKKVKLLAALQKLYDLKFTVCDFSNCEFDNIKSVLKMGRKPSLVVIDDLDEFRAANKSDVIIKIKMLSRKLDIPFIICDRIWNIAENRKTKSPFLGDFKENLLLFDVVMFLNRKAYREGMSDYDMRKTKLIISKNCNGEIGCIDLLFKNEKCSFVDSKSYI